MTVFPVIVAAVRLSLWMDNPNKAAALLALLAVPVVAVACRARGMLASCVAWCATGTLGLLLGLTQSRGGLVALAVGAAIVVASDWRRLRLPARLCSVAVAALLVFVVIQSGFAARLLHSTPQADDSVANRLLIWRAVPAMIADAPGGWGAGNSGEAFMNWYQPLDRGERYRTLVNSFFTWLVEHGWPCRAAVVFAFLFVLWLCALRLRLRGDPVPLAVWATFVIAAFFSSVAEEWILWVLPLAMLVPSVPLAFRRESRRRVVVAAVSFVLIASAALGLVTVLGHFARPPGTVDVRRAFDGSRVIVGVGEPRAWAVLDTSVVGIAYGRALREFAFRSDAKGRVWGLAESVDAVPDYAERIALCGRAAAEGPSVLSRFSALREVRILSPVNPSAWLAARSGGFDVKVFCGDFSANCPADDRPGLVVVSGAAENLPSWPALAFGD